MSIARHTPALYDIVAPQQEAPLTVSRPSQRTLLVFGAATVVWAGAWVWLTRYYLLDDAFIHLQYAHYLRTTGFLTFDGVHRSDGSSSLLWVALLSIFEGLGNSLLLLKLASVAGYALVLAATLLLARPTRGIATLLWLGLVAALASPMAVRWMCDGMETSLAVLAALGVGMLAHGITRQPARSARRYVMLMAIGAASVTLRIDLALLVAVSSIAACLDVVEQTPHQGFGWSRLRDFFSVLARESHLAIGGLLGLAVTIAATGHLLPDAAFAKEAHHLVLGQFGAIARAFGGSLALGLGLLGVGVVSLGVPLYHAEVRRRHLLSLLVANSPLPVIVALTVLRGQYIQGIRYFLWPLAFSIVWNLQVISSRAAAEQPNSRGWPLRWETRRAATLVLVAVALAWTVDAPISYRVTRDTGQIILDLGRDRLEFLRGKPGVADDIGWISYFSQGQICDLSGLVAGRALAESTLQDRIRYCAAQSPVFAFLTPSQALDFESRFDLDSWRVCHGYVARDATGHPVHYLFLRPDVEAACSEPAPSVRSILGK
ncbi:MAG TPA: hypothetical protein VG204_12685 [Terriglobia bacterium]|nr:hypothetical protein [Terriglobia bacterium]